MIAYDDSFDPPAILVPVTISGVGQKHDSVNIQALIDTGADVSALPEDISTELGLYPFSRLQMEDARGHTEAVYTYEANVAVAGQHSVIMEVILLPFPFMILGRDWLQDHYLLLNGPEQRFLISDRPILTESP